MSAELAAAIAVASLMAATWLASLVLRDVSIVDVRDIRRASPFLPRPPKRT